MGLAQLVKLQNPELSTWTPRVILTPADINPYFSYAMVGGKTRVQDTAERFEDEFGTGGSEFGLGRLMEKLGAVSGADALAWRAKCRTLKHWMRQAIKDVIVEALQNRVALEVQWGRTYPGTTNDKRGVHVFVTADAQNRTVIQLILHGPDFV